MSVSIQSCFRRYEKKYFLTPEQYRAIRGGMAPYMRGDVYGNYTICNLYYDSPDYRLIRASLEKPVYKEKLRVRSYGIPHADEPVFVELKKKFDGVVYKRRIVMNAAEAARCLSGGECPQVSQIGREIDFFLKRYCPSPAVFLSYDREAWAGEENDNLRITFDTNLRWRNTQLDLCNGNYGQTLLPRDRILMEIKIPGVTPLWLARLLSENSVFPTSFSKYGAYYTQIVLTPHFAQKEHSCKESAD